MKIWIAKSMLTKPLLFCVLVLSLLGLGNNAAEAAKNISAPTDFVIEQGGVGEVPITAFTDGSTGVVGVDAFIEYDSSVIEIFSGAGTVQQTGHATEDWVLEYNVVFSSGNTKEIRISAAATDAVDQLPTTNSTLFTIKFQAVAATGPTSSPLIFTTTDLNEVAVDAVNGSVKLGGVTGTAALSPDPVKPGRAFTATVTDADLDTNPASADNVTVTIRSLDSSGGSTKEEQTSLTLTETGATTGVFSAGFSTIFGTTATGGGKFEVEAGNALEIEYDDAFDANGDSGNTDTHEIDVIAGVTGTVTTSPPSPSIGDLVTVIVTDADLDDPSAPDEEVELSVVRFSAVSGMTVVETEKVTVSTSGVGVTIATSNSGTPGTNDGILDVLDGDQIVADYDDPVGDGTGAPVPDILSIITLSASFLGSPPSAPFPSSIEVREPLSFHLSDTDIFSGTRFPGDSGVKVVVKNTTTSETETLMSTSSSTFAFTIPTIFSDASSPGVTPTSENGALGVKPTDVLKIEYTDPRDASGGSSVISSGFITVAGGTKGTVTTAPSSISTSGPVTVTLDDDDLANNIAGLYSGDVTLIVRRGGVDFTTVDIVGDLSETSPGSGVFTAIISTFSPGLTAGDQLIVSYDDAVGDGNVPIDDILSIATADGAFGTLPGTISVGATLSIDLDDLDWAEDTRVSGAGTLSVTVENVSTGEEETVTLTEDPAGSASFDGSLVTVFASGPTVSNNGTMEVSPGDNLVVTYEDPYGASGSATTITSTTVVVTGGGDGSVSLTPAPSFTVGSSVFVSLSDADLTGSSTATVFLRSTRSNSPIETEELILDETTPGSFAGWIATAFASGSTTGSGGVTGGNITLELQAGDKVIAEYSDALSSGGGPATVFSNASTAAGGTTASVSASRLIQAGDGLAIELTDPDLNTDDLIAETTTVTVENTTTPDTETITLTETGIATGIFRATPKASTGSGGTIGDGTIDLAPQETLTVTYDDALNAVGGPETVSATVSGVLWGDASVNDKVGALDASRILQRSILLISFSSYQSAVSNVDASSHNNFLDGSSITALDAAYVLKFVVGLISEFPAQTAVPDPNIYKKVIDHRRLAFGEPTGDGIGLRLPILIDETRDVVSGMLELQYDPAQYRVKGVETGEATKGFLVASRIEVGSVWVALAGAEAGHVGEGAILELELEAIGASTDSAPIRLEQASFNGGQIKGHAVEPLSETLAPQDFSLLPNWPNPFNPETTLRYVLPQAGPVSLTIYDLVGQRVRLLVDEVQAPGVYTLQWNGRDENGMEVASGLYFYRIEAGAFVQTRKMTLVR